MVIVHSIIKDLPGIWSYRSSYGMYFHLIILAFYTVFLASLTANTIHLGLREDHEIISNTSSELYGAEHMARPGLAEWSYVSDVSMSSSINKSDSFLHLQSIKVSATVCIMFAILSILKELVLMYQQVGEVHVHVNE